MPREQRTQLNKRRGTEVPLGKYGSGRTPTVNMPAVAPVKSDGAKLAEAFGMAVGVAGQIVGQVQAAKDKEQAVLDSVNFTQYGTDTANANIPEIEELPVEQRAPAYRERMQLDIESMTEAYKNKSISLEAFKAYVGALQSNYGKYETKAINNTAARVQEDNDMKLGTFLASAENTSYHNLDVKTLATQYNVSPATIADTWLGSQLARVKAEQVDGDITPENALKQVDDIHKTMYKEDQPNIWQNEKYRTAATKDKAYYQGLITTAENKAKNIIIEGIESLDATKGGSSANPAQTVADAKQMSHNIDIALRQTNNKAEITRLKKAQKNANQQAFEYDYLNEQLNIAIESGDYTLLKDHLQADKNVDGIKVKSSTTKTYLVNQINNMDEKLATATITDPQSKELFKTSIVELLKLSKATGVSSKYLEGFEKNFTNNLTTVTSVDEAKKMTIAGTILSESRDNFFTAMQDKLMVQELSKVIDNADLDDDAKLDQFNKIKFKYKSKRSAMIHNNLAATRKFLANYNSEFELLQGKFGDARADSTVMHWVLERSGLDPAVITQEEFNEAMSDNVVVYDRREAEPGFSAGVKGALRTAASFFMDEYDNLVLPNKIGSITNKDKAITHAVTGVLRHHNLDVNDVTVITHSNSVSFYNKETKGFIMELNENNLLPFAKEGKKTSGFDLGPTTLEASTLDNNNYADLSSKQNRFDFIQQSPDFSGTEERAAFMAQVYQESKGKPQIEDLNYKSSTISKLFGKHRLAGKTPQHLADNPEELANTIYGGEWGRKNLGNTQKGDGWKYRGRGLIQLTGRANYEKYGKIINEDLVSSPDLLLDPEISYKAAKAYWDNAVKKKVKDFKDTKTITKLVTGGSHGLTERTKWFDIYTTKEEG